MTPRLNFRFLVRALLPHEEEARQLVKPRHSISSLKSAERNVMYKEEAKVRGLGCREQIQMTFNVAKKRKSNRCKAKIH
jgi:hypothetical protein